VLTNLHIRWIYLAAFLMLAVGFIAIALDALWLLSLPLVPVVYYFVVYKPQYVLYFLAFSTPLSVHLFEERISTINLSIPTEPLIILLVVLVLFKILKAKSFKQPELTAALSLILISDLAWVFITSLTSTMPLISFKFLVSKIWYLVVFYFLLSRLFQNVRFAKVFIWCFVLATVILATYTLYMHSKGSFSRDYAYTAMRPFLPDHGMYAACISFSVPILFVFSLHGGVLKYNLFQRAFAAGLFLYMTLAVALSFTRASWVSLVIAFAVYAVLQLKIRFKYLVFLAVFVVGALAYNFDDILTDLSRNKKESDDNIENHLQSVSNVSSDPSNLERLNRWSSGLRMFEEKPIFGFGPGTYTFQYGIYQLPHQMTIISTNTGSLGGIHSEYLRPLAESGALGALLFLTLVVAVFYLGFRQYYTLKEEDKVLSLAVFLSLVTYLAHAVLNNYSEFDKIAVPFYSFMAVLTALQIKNNYVEKAKQE
jgi:putative inorganic carbon (HCO3(-)) transporter